MELDMQIRSSLSDANWLIAKGGTDRSEVLNRVLGKIDNVLKELDGAELIDLNKVWHQAKDVMQSCRLAVCASVQAYFSSSSYSRIELP